MRNQNQKLKKAIKTTILLGTLAIGGIVALQSHADVEHVNNGYIGADVGLKSTGFKSGYGNGAFKSSHKLGRIFVGTEISPNLDFEMYLEKTLGGSRKNLHTNHNTKVKFFSIGAGMMRKFDTCCENVKLLAGVGIKRSKVFLNGNHQGNVIDASKSKLLLKLTGGVEYMFNERFGTRTLLTYETTNRLKSTDTAISAKLRNSYGASLGVIYKI
jgi:hypothetical protein